ncbi:colicin-like pore-forming protein [Enterobacter hormaechei]|uniref:colicin-like pore-forming protein n=1 Tax=Enterobacter hormaechei TaxID=158836 RepID=UPI00193E7DBB|nr:colicin-like pore-forming protein [Enterobacter hormaechei]
MAWTGFGGSWSNGVHSGGDDSGSIGGSSVVMRAPTSSEVASQFNSYGGVQITASMVSNIRTNDLGGYSADIAGANNTVSSGGSSHTSNTVSGFSGVLASNAKGNNGGAGGSAANVSGSQGSWNVEPGNWSKLPNGYDTTIQGFKYHVTLDLLGKVVSVKQTAPRPYTKAENLKVAVAKANNKKPGEMFPELDFSKGEPERQALAKSEALTAWKTLAPNVRKYDITVDDFKYEVNLDNFGNVTSSRKTQDRPYTKAENLKVAVAKANNKKPGEMFPELDFSKSDPARKSQAEKNAQDIFSSFPTNAISIASDFHKAVADKFGEKFSKEAKALAEASKGKKIRNAAEAIKAFDKYKGALNKKYGVADRQAIANALESLDKKQMAAQLSKFGKMFFAVSETLQWSGFINGIVKGFRTGDWNDAIINGEKIAASKLASYMVVVAFGAIATTPIGIIGFAAILAITSALITDDLMKKMNDLILSL